MLYGNILKKSGFTLIEIMIVISIISTIFSFSLIKIGGFSNLKNKIDVDEFDNEIINFIVKSKKYCRNKNSAGYIRFDTNNRDIAYYNNLNRIYKISIPEKFSMNVNTSDNKIHINSRGIVQDACSIQFKDAKGYMHCITVNVGTFYADIKY